MLQKQSKTETKQTERVPYKHTALRAANATLIVEDRHVDDDNVALLAIAVNALTTDYSRRRLWCCRRSFWTQGN